MRFCSITRTASLTAASEQIVMTRGVMMSMAFMACFLVAIDGERGGLFDRNL
jgi:hypothetical protein